MSQQAPTLTWLLQVVLTDNAGLANFGELSLAEGSGYCGTRLPPCKHLECKLVVEAGGETGRWVLLQHYKCLLFASDIYNRLMRQLLNT